MDTATVRRGVEPKLIIRAGSSGELMANAHLWATKPVAKLPPRDCS